MIKAYKELPLISKDTKMIMQVHDELVLEVPDRDIEQVSQVISEIMCSVADLSVPLLVESGTGKNWAEAH